MGFVFCFDFLLLSLRGIACWRTLPYLGLQWGMIVRKRGNLATEIQFRPTLVSEPPKYVAFLSRESNFSEEIVIRLRVYLWEFLEKCVSWFCISDTLYMYILILHLWCSLHVLFFLKVLGFNIFMFQLLLLGVEVLPFNNVVWKRLFRSHSSRCGLRTTFHNFMRWVKQEKFSGFGLSYICNGDCTFAMEV